jgi:cytochrome c oxidase subunit 2
VPNYLLSVDHPLVVPADVKVRVLLTAQDVIHAWWVPALAVKKDAIPGMINEIWFQIQPDKVGLYRGQCAELCGRDHGFMPIVVDAKSPADYAAWLATKKPAPVVAEAAAAATSTDGTQLTVAASAK